MEITGTNGTTEKQEKLLAAMEDQVSCIRVCGRATFKISTTLRRFVENAMTMHGITTFRINLTECSAMDSTFMGTLAGLSNLTRQNKADLRLTSVSDKNYELLHTLGIDQIVDISRMAAPCACDERDSGATLEVESESALEKAETMLDAHKALAELSRENIARFKNVITFLQEDVDRLKND